MLNTLIAVEFSVNVEFYLIYPYGINRIDFHIGGYAVDGFIPSCGKSFFFGNCGYFGYRLSVFYTHVGNFFSVNQEDHTVCLLGINGIDFCILRDILAVLIPLSGVSLFRGNSRLNSILRIVHVLGVIKLSVNVISDPMRFIRVVGIDIGIAGNVLSVMIPSSARAGIVFAFRNVRLIGVLTISNRLFTYKIIVLVVITYGIFLGSINGSDGSVGGHVRVISVPFSGMPFFFGNRGKDRVLSVLNVLRVDGLSVGDEFHLIGFFRVDSGDDGVCRDILAVVVPCSVITGLFGNTRQACAFTGSNGLRCYGHAVNYEGYGKRLLFINRVDHGILCDVLSVMIPASDITFP